MRSHVWAVPLAGIPSFSVVGDRQLWLVATGDTLSIDRAYTMPAQMPQNDDTMHIPASRAQIEEAVWTLIEALELHPDAPVVPGFTERPDLKELLVADVSDAIEAKRPSTFALDAATKALLALCDYFPHRDEILGMLDACADKIKKGLA